MSFEPSDFVWSDMFGVGVVTEIKPEEESWKFPLFVTFFGDSTRKFVGKVSSFSPSGRFGNRNGHRLRHLTEEEIKNIKSMIKNGTIS